MDVKNKIMEKSDTFILGFLIGGLLGILILSLIDVFLECRNICVSYFKKVHSF